MNDKSRLVAYAISKFKSMRFVFTRHTERQSVNIKLSLSLIKLKTMMMYGGVDVQLHTFLTYELDRGE
jgi:hypothetical protein